MRLVIIMAVLTLTGPTLAPASGSAQERSALITASFTNEQSVVPNERIELVLSRSLNGSKGRLAIFIGSTDVSALFTQEKLRLRYNAKLWALPLGESPVIVYLVSNDDEWTEVARFTLRVEKEKSSGSQQASG